jgi:4-amino-4-deoxy-L-arabinose transferase-like glycosyltransferase
MAWALLLCGAWALLCTNLGRQSLWFDEAWSAYAAGQPTLAAAASADATNPPLYYAALHVFARGLGESEWSLRLFSAFCALLACALSARLAWALASRRGERRAHTAAMLALVFTALLPLVAWAAAEARMYTFITCFVLVGALGLHRVLAHGPHAVRVPGWAWACAAAGPLLVLYAHNTGPVVFVWLNLAFGLGWAWRAAQTRRPRWNLLLPWAAVQAGVLAAWLPYFSTRFLALAGANQSVTSAPEPGAALAFTLWRSLWLTPWERLLSPPADAAPEVLSAGVAALLAVSGTVGLAVALKHRRASPIAWPIAHFALLSGGVVAALLVLENEMHSRYLVMAAPFAAVALALGAAAASRPVRAALCTLVVAGGVLGRAAAENPAYFHDDARALTRWYAEHLTARDQVVAWSYADRYDLAYYWPRMEVAAARITLPEAASWDTMVRLLAPQGVLPADSAIARSVWFTQRADYRGMLGCLLAHGRAQPHRAFTVNGLTTAVYEPAARTSDPAARTSDPAARISDPAARISDPAARISDPAAVPAFVPVSAVFLYAGVPAAEVTDAMLPSLRSPADRGLCVGVRVRVLAPGDDPLRAAVIVRDEAGGVVAQADGVFATDDQRLTDVLGAGAAAEAYPVVYLPVGAPAGAYAVFLRVYAPERAPDGLAPAQNAAYGRDLRLGTWQAAPGGWHDAAAPEPLFARPGEPWPALAAVNTGETAWANGGRYPIEVLWAATDAPGILPPGTLPPVLTVRDAGGAWARTVGPGTFAGPAEPGAWARSRWARAVYTVEVPAEAETGTAEVVWGDTVVASVPVAFTPLVTEPPAVNRPNGTAFPGVGVLVGAEVPPTLGAGSFTVTLVWRAGETRPQRDYTAFVQVLDANDRILAQHDSAPTRAGLAYPTRLWRPGEIVADAHTLTLTPDALRGARLPVRIIAGLYDPATMERIATAALGETEVQN